jgi:hypothetical protein
MGSPVGNDLSISPKSLGLVQQNFKNAGNNIAECSSCHFTGRRWHRLAERQLLSDCRYMGFLIERESLAEKKLAEKKKFSRGQAILVRKPSVFH